MATTKSPFPGFIHLPHPPDPRDPKQSGIGDALKWAADNNRAIADNIRRIVTQIQEQRASPLAHASTHRPQTGTDPLATATPTGGYGTTAAVGVGDSFLRNDARFVFPSALSPLANATKTLTLTDDGTDQTLTGIHGRLILAPVGSVDVLNGLIVAKTTAKLSTFGDTTLASGILGGIIPTDATDRILSIQGTALASGAARSVLSLISWVGSAPSAVKPMAFNAFAQHAGTGNLTTTTFGGSLMGGRMGVRFNSASGTGTVSLFSGLAIANQWVAPGAAVTVTEGIGVNVEGLSLSSLTFTSQYSGIRVSSPTAVTALPLHHGILIDALSIGTTKYAIKSSNKIVNIATDIGTEAAGKGFYVKDAVDGHFYRLSTQNGIFTLTDLGTSAPTS